MFKLFKRPPDVPEELDYLAQAPGESDPFADAQAQAPDETPPEASPPQKIAAGIAAKRASKEESSKKKWPLAVAGGALFAAVAFGMYYAFELWDAPVPAAIPKGDIFEALASVPSVAPPGSPAASSKPAAVQQAPASTQQKTPQQAAATSPAQAAGNSAPQSQAAKPAPKPQEEAKPSAPAQEGSKEVSQTALSGIFGDNPFVDLSALRSVVALSSPGLDLPRIGASGNMALPEVPRPVVSPDLLPSPGEIRTPAAPGGSQQSPIMGGIIKSSNGDAIAIMGDGTVLSEGDTYKGDRRVTFIGGEGISFDDGNTIAFGGAQK